MPPASCMCVWCGLSRLQPIRSVEVLLGDPRARARARPCCPRADVGRALAAYHGCRAGNTPAFSSSAGWTCLRSPPKGAIAVIATGRRRRDAPGQPAGRTAISALPSPARLCRRPCWPGSRKPRSASAAFCVCAAWALSLSAIDRIDVFLGDRLLGVAEASISREDVRAAHPEYPNGSAPGFLLQRDLPQGRSAGRRGCASSSRHWAAYAAS